MSMESSTPWRRSMDVLVTYRTAVYVAGVAVVALLWLLGRTGVTVAPTVRTAVVAVAVGAMIVTYVAELLVVQERNAERRGPPRGGYPTKTKVAVAIAAVGLAAGAYLALTGNFWGGLFFLAGSYLFAKLGFGAVEDADGGSGGRGD